MKNEEIIEILKGKLEYYNSSLAEYYDEELINALEEANKKIKENDKLKAEIEALRNELKWTSEKRDLALAEIEWLKGKMEWLRGKAHMYRDMADSFSNSSLKLKAEINELNAGLKCKEGNKVTLRSMCMCPMVLPGGLCQEIREEEQSLKGGIK